MTEPVEERVRPCLECGTILPFDAELCSLCGVSVRPGARKANEPEAVKPCLACEALIGESALFCPDCGDFTLSVAAPDAGTIPPVRESGSAVAFVSRSVSVLIAASAAAMLIAVAIDFARTRGFSF